MALRKDIWRPAIVGAPFEAILAAGSLADFPLTWLPTMARPFTFLADPFGLWRDGRLHVFVESYDYRVRVGWIEVLVFDAALDFLYRAPVLREPWHLSYPQVFEAEGETWLLPEAHRSGRLTLYRAVDFPTRWVPSQTILLDHVPVDATPLFYAGRWWLFYTSASAEPDKMSALHIAFADRLVGRWQPHPLNPIRRDRASARPGGTARMIDGRVVLPVQDCGATYGGAIRPLVFTRLDPDRAECEPGRVLAAPPSFAPFTEGLHTLAAAGPVTLIDAKRTELSLRGLAIEARRALRKHLPRGGTTPARGATDLLAGSKSTMSKSLIDRT